MTITRSVRKAEEIRCELSEAEIQERAHAMARAHEQIALLEEQKKASAADFREQIKEKRRELQHLVREVRERAVDREVLCETRADLGAGVMETYRLDTGDLVRSRPLTWEERQGRLFPVDEDDGQTEAEL